MISYKKQGGLHFVRVGCLGASFYVTTKHKRTERRVSQIGDIVTDSRFIGWTLGAMFYCVSLSGMAYAVL